MSTESNDQYRAGFEAWMKARPGYPFAATFANLMWESWIAAKSEASTEPSAPGPRAWIERRYAGDELVHETVNLQPMPAAQRKELAKHYLLEIIELAPVRAGALSDDAKSRYSAYVAKCEAGKILPCSLADLLAEDAKDAARWRFRKQFLGNGGAIMFTHANCQLRRTGDLIACGETEQDAIDAAIEATKTGSGT